MQAIHRGTGPVAGGGLTRHLGRLFPGLGNLIAPFRIAITPLGPKIPVKGSTHHGVEVDLLLSDRGVPAVRQGISPIGGSVTFISGNVASVRHRIARVRRGVTNGRIPLPLVEPTVIYPFELGQDILQKSTVAETELRLRKPDCVALTGSESTTG